MNQVYFVPSQPNSTEDQRHQLVRELWQQANLSQVIHKNDITALKLHVGEPGNQTFLKPDVAKTLVECIRLAGSQAFLTDTAVLYQSPRDNGVTHARVAQEHGFGFADIGAPFLPADGILGNDEVEVKITGKHFTEASIASAIMHANSLVVLSHVTGHLATGLAATIKNLGMGCSSRKGKLRQHHGQHPRINTKACTACGICAEWCPAHAITVGDVAIIDNNICIGCGECVSECRDNAVGFGWGMRSKELQERIVEYASAVTSNKKGRIAYMTIAESITKDCDCIGRVQKPVVEDIGLLASMDPVALDKASLDLVQERAGKGLAAMTYPKHDPMIQIRYAEELGLGSSTYELLEIKI